MELIRELHHKRGMHSYQIQKWFLNRVEASEQLPSQRKHHLEQVIASLQGHERHKVHHVAIFRLLRGQVG
jgi:hypothetical protein